MVFGYLPDWVRDARLAGMEITFRVTEEDYIDAYRLKCKTPWRKFAWACALAILLLLWTIVGASFLVEHLGRQGSSSTESATSMRANLAPATVIVTLGVLINSIGIPWLLKRQFRKNKNFNAEFTTEVNAEGITQKSSMGSSSHTLWNAFKGWRESEKMVIIEFPSGLYLFLPKSKLSTEQGDELRSILMAFLPKR
jgi:YcxB-like protein